MEAEAEPEPDVGLASSAVEADSAEVVVGSAVHVRILDCPRSNRISTVRCRDRWIGPSSRGKRSTSC